MFRQCLLLQELSGWMLVLIQYFFYYFFKISACQNNSIIHIYLSEWLVLFSWINAFQLVSCGLVQDLWKRTKKKKGYYQLAKRAKARIHVCIWEFVVVNAKKKMHFIRECHTIWNHVFPSSSTSAKLVFKIFSLLPTTALVKCATLWTLK